MLSHFAPYRYLQQTFRYADGIWPNLAAMGFILLAYPGGLFLLMQSSAWLNLIGFCFITLSLIWSAYYIHELAHHSIFKKSVVNHRWGVLMTWINGSCYATFDALRKKHMRHHVERADVVTFDVHGFVKQSPTWFRKMVIGMEWMYIPAVELLMHIFVMYLPFRQTANQPDHLSQARWRMAGIIAVRLTAFSLLAWYALKAWLLYGLAYLIFITVLRFADCFQHTYDAYPILDDAPIPADKLRDRAYEQANTYSNVVGLDHPLLNLLWLNFGYHNAHHEKPALPWHQLPQLHRQLFGVNYGQVIPVKQLFKSFHINRIRRIVSDDYGYVDAAMVPHRADQFLGAVGVSFLTAV